MVSIQKKKLASSIITENLSNKKYLLYDPIFVKKKKRKDIYNMCTYISLYKHNTKSGRIHSKSLIVMAEGGVVVQEVEGRMAVNRDTYFLCM